MIIIYFCVAEVLFFFSVFSSISAPQGSDDLAVFLYFLLYSVSGGTFLFIIYET